MGEKQATIVLIAKDLASGNISKVKGELNSLGTGGSVAARGLSIAEKSAGSLGNALGHAKSQIGGLIGSVGLLAGAGGLLSLGGAFEQGISKASAMALAVEKVTSATGLTAEAASQTIAVFEKYGVSADSTATMLGRLEKNAFTAASTTKLAKKFQTEYGLSLVDSSGKVKDAQTLISDLSDYYLNNSNIAQRDAAMGKLLGRSWIDLVPILKNGSKGLAEATAQADAMGLTLKSAQDVTNVEAFIAAQRNAQEAIGGLEMQLGLLVMPDLASGLTTFTNYVETHQDDIKNFFRQGLDVAETLGGFITGTLLPVISSITGVVSKVWGSIPGPLQQLLVGGFVAQKATSWLFGGGGLLGAVKGIVGGLLGSGSAGGGAGGVVSSALGVQKVFVVNMPPGGLGGGGVGNGAATAAEDTGLATVGNVGGLGVLGGALTLGAGAAVAGVAVNQYMNTSSQADQIASQTGDFVKTATLAQLTAARQSVADAAQKLINQPWNPFAPAAEGGLNDTLKQLNAAIDAKLNSSSGGTGGMVGQDVYPVTLSATADGVIARAVANGLHPTASGITATLQKNSTAVADAFRSFRSGEHSDLAAVTTATMQSSAAIVAAIQGQKYTFLLNSPSLTKPTTLTPSPRDNVTNNRLLVRSGGGRIVSPL